MLYPIKYESNIKIKDIPLQWIPRFEFYYPDLPQFPTVYVHLIKNKKRIYGFPVSSSIKINKEGTCDVDILFLSNEDLEKNDTLKKEVQNELEERFGVRNKIGLKDLISYCNGDKKYEDFFKELWKYVSKVFGDYIPYGKFYEEIYSIVRFVSAWQPKTGRQSEMRMLYNFLSIFGESIEVKGKWSFMEFFLIPTYDDFLNKNFSDFPEFNKLYLAMKKIWDLLFIKKIQLDDFTISSLNGAWPQDKDAFINKVTIPLFRANKINIEDRLAIERLVDAFNRHSWRAAFFIWSVMSIYNKDYKIWDKDFFIKFYENKNGVGISEKVVACFLQQGFKNDEVIPIDTWVQSFYELALGIPERKNFFNSFSKLGRIERVIWLSSQANKTNNKTFFDLLWCTRFGETGNNELRGANPISCYECKLREKCPSYSNIKNKDVLIIDKSKVILKELKTSKGNIIGMIIDSPTVIAKANSSGCYFICITEDKVPKKIFINKGSNWKLIDEFSGFLLNTQKIKKDIDILSVEKLISSLPLFFKECP